VLLLASLALIRLGGWYFFAVAPGPRKLAKGARFVAAFHTFAQHGTTGHWSLLLSFALHAAATGALPLLQRQRAPPEAWGLKRPRATPNSVRLRLRARPAACVVALALLVAARAERPSSTRSPATGGGGAMGGWPRLPLLALALCCLLTQPPTSRAFFFGVRTSARLPQVSFRRRAHQRCIAPRARHSSVRCWFPSAF